MPDLSVGVNYNHFTQATNPIDPSPAWNALALQLSLPIPLSNLNQGQLQAAHFAQLQAQQALEAVELKVETDVRGAYERYDIAVDSVAQYAKASLAILLSFGESWRRTRHPLPPWRRPIPVSVHMRAWWTVASAASADRGWRPWHRGRREGNSPPGHKPPSGTASKG